MDILEKILKDKQIEVRDRKQAFPEDQLRQSPYFKRTSLSLKDSVRDKDKNGIIAEIKFQSPSKGVINDTSTVEEVAAGYVNAGVSAISILTDEKYFGGGSQNLMKVRDLFEIPLLRKDFMIDEYQLTEAKAMGADIILLIAAALKPEKLKSMAAFAKDLGLNVLVEVHNKEELEFSINDNIDALGVNNRNLKTFEVSLQNSIELAEDIPDSYIKVSESGIYTPADIMDLKKYGYESFLIGEKFMSSKDPSSAIADFVSELKEKA